MPRPAPGALSPEILARSREEFEADPRHRVAMNAATHGNLEEIALSRRVVDGLDWNFSHEVPVGGVTAQRSAGTCWIYAGLKGLSRSLGVLDNDLYEYDLLFDTSFEWDRGERMAYRHQRPTHCMVLIGVDLDRGRPVKWKIENSWGDELGHKGVFQMSDAWFEEHVYGITVHGKDLGKKLRKLFDQDPVVLPPWHTLC